MSEKTEEKSPTQTSGLMDLLRQSLFDETGKVSSSRLQGQQLVALGWIISIGGLILTACGKDVSSYALGVLGIVSGQGASNVWASQKAKKATMAKKADSPKSDAPKEGSK